MSDAIQVLILCQDLLFTSSLHGAVQRAGLRGGTCLGMDQCLARIDAGGDALRCLIVDLELPGLDWSRLQGGVGGRFPIVAFGPHVRTDLFQSAQAAGITAVLTRGQAVSAMDALLAKLK